MTQKTNSRVIIDTNRHGIRREINLDSLAKKAQKRRDWENKTKKPWMNKDKDE